MQTFDPHSQGHHYIAEFERGARPYINRWWKQQILVHNVRRSDGKKIRDHMWISLHVEVDQVDFRKGGTIKFLGRPRGTRKMIEKWGHMALVDVAIFEINGKRLEDWVR